MLTWAGLLFQYDWSLYKKKETWTQTHSGRTPCDDGDRGWSDAAGVMEGAVGLQGFTESKAEARKDATQSLGGSMAFLTPWFQSSNFWKYERNTSLNSFNMLYILVTNTCGRGTSFTTVLAWGRHHTKEVTLPPPHLGPPFISGLGILKFWKGNFPRGVS